MYHLNDKDLDRLSKEAADQYDMEKDPSGWDKLGQKLDKEMPVKEDKDRKRWLLFLLLLVSLAGGGTAWLLSSSKNANKIEALDDNADRDKLSAAANEKSNDNSSIATPNTSASNPNEDVTDAKTSDERTAGDPSTSIKDEKNADEPGKKSGEQLKDVSAKDEDGSNAPNATSSTKKSESITGKKKQTNTPSGITKVNKQNKTAPAADAIADRAVNNGNTSGKLKRSSNLPVTNKRKSGTGNTAVSDVEKSNSSTLTAANNRNRSSADHLKSRTAKNNSSSTVTAGEDEVSLASGSKKQSSKNESDDARGSEYPEFKSARPIGIASITNAIAVDPANFGNTDPVVNASVPASQGRIGKRRIFAPETGLELGLVLAPDLTTVKFNTRSEFGYNVGLQIGYRFSSRLSANTGIIYTKKNYSAAGKDFTAPPHFWTTYVDELKSVEGYCEMFDIPLNIRYDLLSNSKRKLFLSAGVSNYLMTGENYKYHYIKNGVYMTAQAPYNDNSNYFFSILNFSAGFERKISRKFSLQVEPYFKVPLKGVGFGSLDLNSYGVYFSLKYKPSFWK